MPFYRVRAIFDCYQFKLGNEDGFCFGDEIISKNLDADYPQSGSYPGYSLKEAELLQKIGIGYDNSKFQHFIKAHNGNFLVNPDCWIAVNPNGDKDVYLPEDFHQIYEPI